MKLGTLEQRHKCIKDMIEKAFQFEDSLIHDSEHQDDWTGAMTTVENLMTIEEFIRTEEIFLDAFAEMENVPSRDNEGKEIFLTIVYENLVLFTDTVLLRKIEYAFDYLNDWDFVTEDGIKFKKNFSKKLDALIKTYQDIYDL